MQTINRRSLPAAEVHLEHAAGWVGLVELMNRAPALLPVPPAWGSRLREALLDQPFGAAKRPGPLGDIASAAQVRHNLVEDTADRLLVGLEKPSEFPGLPRCHRPHPSIRSSVAVQLATGRRPHQQTSYDTPPATLAVSVLVPGVFAVPPYTSAESAATLVRLPAVERLVPLHAGAPRLSHKLFAEPLELWDRLYREPVPALAADHNRPVAEGFAHKPAAGNPVRKPVADHNRMVADSPEVADTAEAADTPGVDKAAVGRPPAETDTAVEAPVAGNTGPGLLGLKPVVWHWKIFF